MLKNGGKQGSIGPVSYTHLAVTFQNAKDVLLMGWGMNWQYAAQTPTEEYCGCPLYTSGCPVPG